MRLSRLEDKKKLLVLAFHSDSYMRYIWCLWQLVPKQNRHIDYKLHHAPNRWWACFVRFPPRLEHQQKSDVQAGPCTVAHRFMNEMVTTAPIRWSATLDFRLDLVDNKSRLWCVTQKWFLPSVVLCSGHWLIGGYGTWAIFLACWNLLFVDGAAGTEYNTSRNSKCSWNKKYLC